MIIGAATVEIHSAVLAHAFQTHFPGSAKCTLNRRSEYQYTWETAHQDQNLPIMLNDLVFGTLMQVRDLPAFLVMLTGQQ